MARPKTSTLPPKPAKDNQFIPQQQGRKNVREALHGPMREGQVRAGFLGQGNIIHKPDYVAYEQLSDTDRARKKSLQAILGTVIEPNALSSKSTATMDRRSLVNKLSKSSFDDILRMVPDSVKDMSNAELAAIATGAATLDEQAMAEIQNLYLDVSP